MGTQLHNPATCPMCSEVGHFRDNGWDVNDLARAVGKTTASVTTHLAKYAPQTRDWWKSKEDAR